MELVTATINENITIYLYVYGYMANTSMILCEMFVGVEILFCTVLARCVFLM